MIAGNPPFQERHKIWIEQTINYLNWSFNHAGLSETDVKSGLNSSLVTRSLVNSLLRYASWLDKNDLLKLCEMYDHLFRYHCEDKFPSQVFAYLNYYIKQSHRNSLKGFLLLDSKLPGFADEILNMDDSTLIEKNKESSKQETIKIRRT